MNDVQVIPIQPLYKKPNGVYVQEIDREDLPLGFSPLIKHLVTIPAGAVSANHAHPRFESFIGIGKSLKFYWIDKNGDRKYEDMTAQDGLLLFIVPPHVPHAILNESDAPAVLLEYADRAQNEEDITHIDVI